MKVAHNILNIAPTPILIKLGGSLLNQDHLKAWLQNLTDHNANNLILVAGGGIFADSVRTAQQISHFSEQAAHEMALLAMQQYAILLQDLCESLQPFTNFAELAAILTEKQKLPIWYPTVLCSEYAAEIEASWQMTSDSLAAWLAKKIGARQLILIKSAPCPTIFNLESLAAQGLVDELFPRYAAQLQVKLFSAQELECCAAFLKNC